jgi:hypothetical protein
MDVLHKRELFHPATACLLLLFRSRLESRFLSRPVPGHRFLAVEIVIRPIEVGSRNVWVGTVARIWAGRSWNRSIPDKGRSFISSPKCRDQPPIQWVRQAVFPRVDRRRPEAKGLGPI